jgi:pimeloyl-ACP methyl ester carboxylesterase
MIIITIIVIGEFKWQLFPLVLVVITLILKFQLESVSRISLPTLLKKSFIILTSLFLFISLVSLIVFPQYKLPLPSGSYLIGTESKVIEDNSRLELYSEKENDLRKIKIQIWYPAETVLGYDISPWIEDGIKITRGLSRDIGLPYFMLDHTALIPSNSYYNAPISNISDSYPIVILSHGWRGFRNIHTDYAEELASRGYIVIGIDHVFGSVATAFEEETVYLNKDALPERETTPDFLDYANALVSTYAQDITFTLDYIELLNQDSSSRFFSRFDLEKIGLLGHSTGGGAATNVGLMDERINAVIGLDAWVEPILEDEIALGLKIPSLFLKSETWETGLNNEVLSSLVDSSSYVPQVYQIDGTTHYDFAMVYMYSPLTKAIGFNGSLDNEYLNNIIKTMINDFFDKELRNITGNEVDITPWEEVKVVN